MDRLLELVGEPTPVALPAWLEDLLSAGLLERDGCLFLAAYAPPAGSSVPPQLQDRTGWEAFVNHFHIDPIDDLFGDLVLAANAARHLIEQIELLGLGFSVRVILGRNLDGEFPNSTVRLHRVRPGEIWLTADLEGYETEAIAYIDSPPGPVLD